MKIIDCTQGTPEWKAARAGRVTASRICDVLAKIKTGEAAARRNYKAQILAEILTGEPSEDVFVNAAMTWGTENEPMARAMYEITRDVMVDQVGFILHETIDRAGASPDGLIGEDGGLELKCPKTATHLDYLLGGVVPAEYVPQVQWNMACTGRKWWDFGSYDPRLPEHLQLFVVRAERDEKVIAEIEAAVVQFLSEVDAILERLPKAEMAVTA